MSILLCLTLIASGPALLRGARSLAVDPIVAPNYHDARSTQSQDLSSSDCLTSNVCEDGFVFGNTTYGTSRGVFPSGCQWREVFTGESDDSSYQFWDSARSVWDTVMPAACTVKYEEVPSTYVWNKSDKKKTLLQTPATGVEPKGTHTIMKNLWYNNGRWYALVEGDKYIKNIKMSRNQQITCIHVKNATAWIENTKHRIVPGDTLLFDYIFFIHPTAIGHWCEMMFPLYSILKESSFNAPNVNVVLLHLQRKHLMEWVRAVMATTLHVPPGGDLPPIWLQEKATPGLQTISPLEGVPADTWVSFERALVVRDLFTGGKRSFASTAHAREFRKNIYQAHQLTVPPSAKSGTKPPPLITFQRKRANRRIINEKEVLDLLRTYAPVQVVEFNSSHSFAEQLRTVANTGVFVSVHTSNLANSVFLPPGSAVVELIQRFWSWRSLDKSFKDQTDRMGDIHHFAWRAFHVNQTVYLKPRDLEKFANWTNDQCHLEECVEAHTNVDIIADIEQLKTMLDARIPRVLAGEKVSKLASVWPSPDPKGDQPWIIPPGEKKGA